MSDYDSWIDVVCKKFCALSPSEQTLTVRKLISCSHESTRYQILTAVCKILKQDMLTLLPIELQEHVCNYIDAKTLFRACRVSKDWNRIITSLNHTIWKKKCMENYLGGTNKYSENWKQTCRWLLKVKSTMLDSSAFCHEVIHIKQFGNQISSLAFANNYLIAGSECKVAVWRLRSGKIEYVTLISIAYRISCLNIDKDGFITAGHSGGEISILRYFPSQERIYSQRILECHAGIVLSVCLKTEIDLIASASTDQSAKLWSFSSGDLLRTLVFNEWVVAVNLYPSKRGFNDQTLLCDKHSMIVKTFEVITFYEWKVENKQLFGDLDTMEDYTLNSDDEEKLCPGYGINLGMMYQVLQTEVSKFEFQEAVLLSNCPNTAKITPVMILQKKVRKLLHVGKLFAILLLQFSGFSGADNYNLIVVDLKKRLLVGGCHLPHSSSCTPESAQIALGDTSWLDGLSNLASNKKLMLAVGMSDGSIHVIMWNLNFKNYLRSLK